MLAMLSWRNKTLAAALFRNACCEITRWWQLRGFQSPAVAPHVLKATRLLQWLIAPVTNRLYALMTPSVSFPGKVMRGAAVALVRKISAIDANILARLPVAAVFSDQRCTVAVTNYDDGSRLTDTKLTSTAVAAFFMTAISFRKNNQCDVEQTWKLQSTYGGGVQRDNAIFCGMTSQCSRLSMTPVTDVLFDRRDSAHSKLVENSLKTNVH
jgi:hypothetical protein